jgi:phosphoribosylformimino-5-aminoimidazole carboxamide ribotide isomerase
MTDELRSRLLPVLDLKNGQVVRGIGGRRDEYRPIISKWTDSSDPLTVAIALREHFGFERFYVADLGAICERVPHTPQLDALIQEGFELDLDAGARSQADCASILETPRIRAVLGLETIESPQVLERIAAESPAPRLAFSLDLKSRLPLATPHWPASALEIASIAIGAGIQTLIVLDLAAVGSNGGCPTLPLCREIRACWPHVELITGAGVRNELDVHRAIDSGVDQVLVASALHDGRLR